MAMPLLTTKLNIPPVRSGLVPRPRLTERLNEGVTRMPSPRKLTLVSAPAGFGKTTLVAEWLTHRRASGDAGRPVAWLSLDEEDNDPARFFTYLVAALQTVDPDIGQAAQAMLQAPQPPPPEPLLTSLINDVAATPRPFVLVLDDYHLIHTLPIHRQLAFLLEHQPPQMHLVIASREDPPLPLSRLRARGQAREIRRADLQFTPEETAEFLQQVARQELPPRDVAALQRRTEGWAAGLQLLALSIRGRDDVLQLVRSFTGSHRYVLDYLIEEVFEQQSAEAQDFLLKTAILDRFTAALCDAVTGRNDGRAVLLALDQANLFIVRLDESRQWYRYHRLFADLLRHRLEVASTHELAQLHRRASRWYAANGLPADAVQHALAGSDWERAATLTLDLGESMLKRGEVATLLGWLQALPDEEVCTRPQLCLSYSWALILTSQLDAAEFYLRRAEQAAEDAPALLGDIAAALAFIARTRGDDRRTIELSRRALSLLRYFYDNDHSRLRVGLRRCKHEQAKPTDP
jgi:LuxR family maltose regulon positive regulatory protein